MTPRHSAVSLIADDQVANLCVKIVTMVSMTGRPLLMTQIYNTTPLPLDIGNSTLYGVGVTSLDEARANINELGWNKNTSKFSVSFLRARGQFTGYLYFPYVQVSRSIAAHHYSCVLAKHELSSCSIQQLLTPAVLM